ncbi:hypothetical protein [Phreatobacter stygius]|uniref:Uncharacterized protein n=1 Tax=Phreatobacter stygius TaxID=1940610 RepID=A0A4D7AZ32_9HYPH|nr:hypothetical protein [Phreatobacter stygius]QCI66724.1 hypothetical protein E8M01_22275 [Phreatobacter stygius]
MDDKDLVVLDELSALLADPLPQRPQVQPPQVQPPQVQPPQAPEITQARAAGATVADPQRQEPALQDPGEPSPDPEPSNPDEPSEPDPGPADPIDEPPSMPVTPPAPVAVPEPALVSAAPLPASSPQTSPETATMIPWIATKQFTVDLFPSWTKTEGDKEWSLGAVTVDVPDITAKLDQLIASLNEDQWEIKLVVPLDKSLTYHEHQKVMRQGSRREPEAVLGAFGLGWAANTTASLLVVCQRTEWLDAIDYKARIKARQDRIDGEARRRDRAQILEQNAAVNAKITAAQKALEDLKANGVAIKKSGFLRGEKFVVAGIDYTNRTEAEAAHRARLGELEADLAALPKQLKSLPSEA